MLSLVYDIAAESGGAITILDNYFENAKEDVHNSFVFVVSHKKYKSQNNIAVYCFSWIKKSWFHRIFFDIFFLKKFIRKFNFDYVISLQNSLVPHIKSNQTIYFHNMLFISKYRINFIKNPKLWIYKHLYSKIVFYSLKKANKIIVQAKWISDLLSIKLNINPKKIHIQKPIISWTKEFSDFILTPIIDKSIIIFFYPTSSVEFKNLRLISECTKIIPSNYFKNFRILLTVSAKDNYITKKISREICKYDLPISLIGYKSKADVFNIYCQSVLLFTSLVESSPLPLIEASRLNREIIVSDLPYAHEILENYNNVIYFNPNSAKDLSKIIINYLEMRSTIVE